MTDHSLRRRWCASLAKLVSPSFPDDAAAALTDMLPALKHLPDSLFTGRTLIEVAERRFAPKSGRQSVPAFDEIVATLNHYRRTYLPDPTLRIDAPREPEARRGPCPEELAAVTETLTSWRQEVAARRVSNPQPEARPLRDVTLKGEALRRSREACGLHVQNRDASPNNRDTPR